MSCSAISSYNLTALYWQIQGGYLFVMESVMKNANITTRAMYSIINTPSQKGVGTAAAVSLRYHYI